jgi:hypothetical protein
MHQVAPTPPRVSGLSSLLICCGAAVAGGLLPVLVGLFAGSLTPSEGGLNGLFTVFGLFASTVTAPIAFLLAAFVLYLRHRKAARTRSE